MERKTRTLKILVANGVNLDLLGQREAVHYGTSTLVDLEAQLRKSSQEVAAAAATAALDKKLPKIELIFFQSNSEAEFLQKISDSLSASKPCHGILLNAGAWTHTSLALADRLVALGVPFVEVHLSNLSRREDFRQKSFSAPHALGVVYGAGLGSYDAGLLILVRALLNQAAT